jgi:hypothetical protein
MYMSGTSLRETCHLSFHLLGTTVERIIVQTAAWSASNSWSPLEEHTQLKALVCTDESLREPRPVLHFRLCFFQKESLTRVWISLNMLLNQLTWECEWTSEDGSRT